jgi:hypothetical protein
MENVNKGENSNEGESIDDKENDAVSKLLKGVTFLELKKDTSENNNSGYPLKAGKFGL